MDLLTHKLVAEAQAMISFREEPRLQKLCEGI
jgi:hypothetical protein